MVSQKPKIVIIGAGIAGLTAAKKLYTTQNSNELFELCVVEGGNRIGGRIFTTEFCGDRVEIGATWIHGIEGNPIYKIAQEINGFETDKPWDSMGGKVDKKVTITEDGHEVHSSFVNSVSNFFSNLLEFSSDEGDFDGGVGRKIVESLNLEENGGVDKISMGSYLRKGLKFYWGLKKDQENVESFNIDSDGIEKDQENVENFNLKSGGVENDQENVENFNLESGGVENDQENVESFNIDDSGIEKDQDNVESFNLDDGGVEKDQENVESFNPDDSRIEKDQDNVESFNLEHGGVENDQENVESFNIDDSGIEKDQDNVESFNLEHGGVENDQENVESFNIDDSGIEKDQDNVESFNLEHGGVENDQENVESFNIDDSGIEKDQDNVESFNLEHGGVENDQEKVESFNLDDGGIEKDQENVESFNLDDGGIEKDQENVESLNLESGGIEKDGENVEVFENWSRKALEEGIFAMFENIHRHYSSAGDLGTLDFNEESEYCNFPGDEITIAKGYSSVVESLASVLPPGLIQLGRKVSKIEWQLENSDGNKPVKLHFSDGSAMYADHVVVTVSLGVLKQGIREDSSLFSPPLPKFKTEAIARLGFGVVDKVFLQLSPTHHENVGYDGLNFPNMMMVFHQPDSKLKNPKIPLWIRRTTLTHPVYPESRVVVSWFAGEEAMKVETLDDEEIIEGVSITMSEFLANTEHFKNSIKFSKVLKCKWGTDPLFLGSYTHIAVGSSGNDLDAMAEPLPKEISDDKNSKKSPRLQVLFAGEATSRNYYSTTHGAYLTGLREANRLLEHFQCVDV
ncbi:probable polyamine oxidase 5 [Solanum tuberosum]|uniref:Amine oxidase n=1 Tax=Solanum tuberosum TaxID=4113 RepID=M0ZHI2_SOLTU|nr:PREDICTED: probable polyamine oxidase 5 [Solanum tuberosum]